MSLEVHFNIVWALTLIYGVVGNYIYFKKVLPILSEEGKSGAPMFLPSGQLAQAKECIEILAARDERGMIYWYLRMLPATTALIMVAFLTVLLRVLFVEISP